MKKAHIFGNMMAILQKSAAFEGQIAVNDAFAAVFCRNIWQRRASYRARPWDGGAGDARTPWRGEYPQGGKTSSQLFRVLHKISAIPPLHAA